MPAHQGRACFFLCWLIEGEWEKVVASVSPLNRVGLPVDVARCAVFLASNEGEWINGKILRPDGGAGSFPSGED